MLCILSPVFCISQHALDQLEYHYSSNTNQLNYITDEVGSSVALVDIDNQNSNNYSYDANGRLIADAAEGILSIEWNIGDKVKQVTFDDSDPLDGVADRTLQFKYDAIGNCVKKIETYPTTVSPQLTTYYVRNAMGELISIYKDNGSGAERTELEIHEGSDNVAPLPSVSNTEFERKVGFKNYELKDYLGSVRVVVNDVKEPVSGTKKFASKIKQASEYYSYGMLMPGRDYKSSDYRWGYQRKEKDDELKSNGNSYDFGARLLDPRVGRWLIVDPLASKFPNESPYSAMGNNPINMVDMDGKEYESQIAIKWIDYLRVYHADEYDIVEMYNAYVNPSGGVEAQIYIDFMDQVDLDVASGEHQPTRRMQLKEFREKRKELAPIETLLPERPITVISEPDPTPVIPTVVETPDYMKPIMDILTDPYALQAEIYYDLTHPITIPLTLKQTLMFGIEDITEQIERDKMFIEGLTEMNMPEVQPNIDYHIKQLAEHEKTLKGKRKILEKLNEQDELN